LTSIGVYILSYNRPEYLREAVRSVLDQRRMPDRIVILDNGSDPGVRESVSAELAQGVEWMGTGENQPAIWNHRRVLETAKEDLFYLMHDDDRLLPEFIGRQVRFLEAHPDVIASGCNGHLIDRNGRRVDRYAREKHDRGVELYPDSASMAELYSRSYIPFPSIVYRNGYPQRVGFDERYGQMIDAAFLVELAGLGTVAFIDEELFEYRIHPGQDSKALREDHYRLKEELLLEKTKDQPVLWDKVDRRVRSNQTRRWIERSVSQLIRNGSLRGAAAQFIGTRPSRLDLSTVLLMILVPFQYLRRLLNAR